MAEWRVYDLLTETCEWKIDRIYGLIFPVFRREAPTHDPTVADIQVV